MQPVATVVAFGAAAGRAAAELDAAALDCRVIGPGDDLFARLKAADAGSLVFLLADAAGDAAIAAAVKALRILRRRSGDALIVLPPLPATPGPWARERLARAALLSGTCVVQPVAPASWDDAVRCFVEPLAVFGLVGVDPREIRALVRPRAALLVDFDDERSVEQSLRVPEAREALVTCRLRPTSALREVDDAATRVQRLAPQVRLLLAGPEVADAGASALCAVLL